MHHHKYSLAIIESAHFDQLSACLKIFLPIHFSALPTPEGNYQYYIFRIVYLSIQRQMSLNWTDEDPEDYELSLTKASETAPQVLKRLFL